MLIQGRTLGFVAAAVMVLTTTVVSAQCTTCQSDWPGNGGAHGGGRQGQFAEYRAQAGEQVKKIEDRNRAWMKPFNCWDQQAYNHVWSTSVNAGWQNNCILRDCHFDVETGRLNNLGLSKLGEILASNRTQHVWVASHFSPKTAEGRIDNVREAITENYGVERADLVMVSTEEPIRFNGLRNQSINAQYNSQVPVPTIQTSAGSSGGSSDSSGDSGSGEGGQ
ncbi:MAG: hypothetical protein ABL888_17730 [Pirellulaceae bacterium]